MSLRGQRGTSIPIVCCYRMEESSMFCVIARVMELITGRPLFIGTVQDATTESKLAEDALNRARSELLRPMWRGSPR